MAELFSGLTLGAGTYYLVIGGGTSSGMWHDTDSVAITTGAGGHRKWIRPLQFGPASTFLSQQLNVLFLVEAPDEVVPEPGTAITAASALLALLAWHKFRQR